MQFDLKDCTTIIIMYKHPMCQAAKVKLSLYGSFWWIRLHVFFWLFNCKTCVRETEETILCLNNCKPQFSFWVFITVLALYLLRAFPFESPALMESCVQYCSALGREHFVSVCIANVYIYKLSFFVFH